MEDIESDRKAVPLKNLKPEIRRSTILNNQKNKRMKGNKIRKIRISLNKRLIVKMKTMMITMKKNLRNY